MGLTTNIYGQLSSNEEDTILLYVNGKITPFVRAQLQASTIYRNYNVAIWFEDNRENSEEETPEISKDTLLEFVRLLKEEDDFGMEAQELSTIVKEIEDFIQHYPMIDYFLVENWY